MKSDKIDMKTKSKSLFDRFRKGSFPSSLDETVSVSQSKRSTESFYGLWIDKGMLRELKFMAVAQETNVKALVSEAVRKCLLENSTGEYRSDFYSTGLME